VEQPLVVCSTETRESEVDYGSNPKIKGIKYYCLETILTHDITREQEGGYCLYYKQCTIHVCIKILIKLRYLVSSILRDGIFFSDTTTVVVC